MQNNESIRTPDDRGWRFESSPGEDGEVQLDIGYSTQLPNGEHIEFLRARGNYSEVPNLESFGAGEVDAVVFQSTAEDGTTTELLPLRATWNEEEADLSIDLSFSNSYETDEDGNRTNTTEFLGYHGTADFNGFSDFEFDVKGSVLSSASGNFTSDLLKGQVGISLGDGKSHVTGEATALGGSYIFGKGSGNESAVGIDLGLGGTFEFFHGEDTNNDGYGEWGIKSPLIINKRLNETIDSFIERTFGFQGGISVTLKFQPQEIIDQIGGGIGILVRGPNPPWGPLHHWWKEFQELIEGESHADAINSMLPLPAMTETNDAYNRLMELF